VTKVLYVEDNDDNIFMLKMRLELLGDFEVLTAEDGALAPPPPGNPRRGVPHRGRWRLATPPRVNARRGGDLWRQHSGVGVAIDARRGSPSLALRRRPKPRGRELADKRFHKTRHQNRPSETGHQNPTSVTETKLMREILRYRGISSTVRFGMR
jgi:hypothetical protein